MVEKSLNAGHCQNSLISGSEAITHIASKTQYGQQNSCAGIKSDILAH